MKPMGDGHGSIGLLQARLFLRDRCPKVGHSPNVIFSFSFAILVYVKKDPILQKMAGETVMGHGSIGLLQARILKILL